MQLRDVSEMSVFKYFEQVSSVPRPSKHEGRIVSYIEQFAKDRGLDYRRDEVGNIVIYKGATDGYEGSPVVMLQSHVDMVCEKNESSNHDFLNEGIKIIEDNGWLRADGTTLGADNGIGVAMQLALLDAKDIEHGPIECVFTVDEETGLTGAMSISSEYLGGDMLINLDSEDEREIVIGCAGGCSTTAEADIVYSKPEGKMLGLRVLISGLKGGHSGSDIHLGRGNANIIMARWLSLASRECGFRLSYIKGGNLRNAIARECVVEGAVPYAERENVRVLFNFFSADIQEEYSEVDSDVELFMETMEVADELFEESFQYNVVESLLACPHGVVAMSKDLEGLVETSTNLASVESKNGKIIVSTSQRSSVEADKLDIQRRVAESLEKMGARVLCNEGYPGWQPNMKSELLSIATEEYRNEFGEEPEVKAIHAGLECGLLLSKKPTLDMISVGPTMMDVHSPDERLEIASVVRFWHYLLRILKAVNK